MGISKKQIRAHQQRTTARLAANLNPAPGPLAQALTPDPIVVGPFTLNEFVGGHLLILQRIDSPFFRQIVEDAKPKGEKREPVKFEDEDAFEALYVLTTPLPQLRALLAKGRQSFRETALAATLDAALITSNEAAAAVTSALVRAFSTRLALRKPDGEDATANFTTPAPSEARSTASAGGSTSTRG
jgi:hypothetical protein